MIRQIFFLTIIAIALSSCAHRKGKWKDKQDFRHAKIAVTELFVATDNKDWEKVEALFSDKVDFDMTSLAGGNPAVMSGKQIAEAWNSGLQKVDHIHHQAGNFLFSKTDQGVDVFCYATATHYVEKTGKLTTFVGSYNFHLVKRADRWIINKFKFNKKYVK